MPSWSWLNYAVFLGPLWLLITALLVLARLLGKKASRLAAVAAICLIAVPVSALLYMFLTGWRPTFVHTILLIVSTVASEIATDRADRRFAEPAADLAQRGRDANRRLRSELTKLGLAIAILAVWLSTIQHPRAATALVAGTALWTLIWLPPFMRRLESSVDVIISCTPQQAFDFVSDATNQPRYLPWVESVQRLTLGSPHIGSRIRVHQLDGSHAVEEIVEYDRPRRLAVALPEMLKPNRSIWTFEPVPAGTRVRYAYRYDLNIVSALGGVRLTSGLAAAQRNAWRRAFLQRLRTVLENPQASLEREWTA